MSKPIFLTKEYIDGMVAEFRKSVSDAKMSDGKITFTKSFDYSNTDNVKAQVVFTPKAYIKMLMLLKHYDSEVAWHGTVNRKDDLTFVITDIVVYPQTVTGSTVNTDQEEYQKWLMSLDDEYFNSMRMQGHSHVNMGTTPSGVDTNHQSQILAQLKNNEYYVFMIFNKRLDHTVKIYDYANNVMYEDKDITLSVAGDDFDIESFIAESDAVVKHKTYAAEPTGTERRGYGYYPYGGYGYDATAQKNKEIDKSAKKSTDNKEKPKRGRPPKKEEPAMTQYPGYYGGNFVPVRDWDREIYGDTYET